MDLLSASKRELQLQLTDCDGPPKAGVKASTEWHRAAARRISCERSIVKYYVVFVTDERWAQCRSIAVLTVLIDKRQLLFLPDKLTNSNKKKAL